jgi:hypothetical protein
VLGVVYRRGDYFPAGDDPESLGDIVQGGDGDVAPGDYLLVVTSGLAQVRVEPGLASIAPGQSLTVAAADGRAAAAGADTAPGLVFGQAMEAAPDADGLLWALIGSR